MDDAFFRHLDTKEEEQFRQWARDNFDPHKEADPVWHPCVRDEWQKLMDAAPKYFWFEAQTGIVRKEPPSFSNFYNYRLPREMLDKVVYNVNLAKPTTSGLEYKESKEFFTMLEKADLGPIAFKIICEE